MIPEDEHLFPEMNSTRYGTGRRRPVILPKLLARAADDMRLRTEAQDRAFKTLAKWADLESSGKLKGKKETALQGLLLSDVFGDALGYALFSENLPQWEIEQAYAVPGGEADGAIGFFGTQNSDAPRALIELKGPTVNLDRDRFRGRTPVQQLWDYLNAVPACPWGILCNYVSFRLYHRNKTPQAYMLFTLQELRERKRFEQFYYLFGHAGLLPHLKGQKARADTLLDDTDNRQREVGGKLYEDYHQNRVALIEHLRKKPYRKSLDAAIRIVQKLLDRIIFVAFCEDRNLLPANSIEKAWKYVPPFTKVTNPKWQNFVGLFQSIDGGNDHAGINAYDGRLFSEDEEVDGLDLDDRWMRFFKKIGSYDFRDEVNVDVLGRLFEKSITDLEVLRADLSRLGERPIARTSGRRKREGIYYTPPHITEYIVKHTVGACLEARFAELAEQHGITTVAEPTEETRADWISYQEARLEVLRNLRVCDPACGSGAFLIQAFDYLESVYDEVVNALCVHQGDDHHQLRQQISATILRRNLFGVDLSEEAVHIAQLALWIRTAERGKSLADLSQNIKCGNSIVDDREIDPRGFDWASAFGDLVPQGRFDCVISNPPYVKLQNFRKRHPRVAAFLVERYRAAQTGNFDMYLPFMERGLDLLKPDGRMGFIAPNVWLFNEYGRGLRELVNERGTLARFVDFKSHQVFEDATTYTALQFFSGSRRDHINVADAGDGKFAGLSFYEVPYKGLGKGAWALLSERDQDILDKMRTGSVTLAEATQQIFQGLITSDDVVYHLIRLGSGRYFSKALNQEVEIEDEIMKPLVSGEDAVRFATPDTIKHVLFPYLVTETDCRLRTKTEMTRKLKRAWAYLKANEVRLRARESGKFDDDTWWRFGRHQSIDKQGFAKIGVPQTVNRLTAFTDAGGERFFNNVRVNGILERTDKTYSLWFLLGLLNSTALDFFFRRTAKPKDHGYFEANKQFIAPLPVPQTKRQAPVANLARRLAKKHGQRLAGMNRVRHRFVTDLPTAELFEASPLPPKLPERLQSFDELSAGDLLPALEKFAKRRFKPKERENWDTYLAGEQAKLAKLRREIEDAEVELNDRVNRLYDLTRDDIKVIDESVAS